MINAKCHKKDCKGSWHSLSRECSPPLLATGSPRHLEDRFTFTAIIVPVPGEKRRNQTTSPFAELSPFKSAIRHALDSRARLEFEVNRTMGLY